MPDHDIDLNAILPPLEIALRLGLAMIFGGMIGWEREAHDKPAGLRTHMLVALGAAGLMVLSQELVLASETGGSNIRTDPIRVIQGVIIGIGFLGAGTIIRTGTGIQGLTTGAAIWAAGVVGLACGGGYYFLAGAVVVGALLTLIVVGLAERLIWPSDRQ